MPRSDMNTGPRDVTDEVGAGDGTGKAIDHEITDDGNQRKSSPYGGFGHKVPNKVKPATKNNSADR
jgi:hypothetical protein